MVGGIEGFGDGSPNVGAGAGERGQRGGNDLGAQRGDSAGGYTRTVGVEEFHVKHQRVSIAGGGQRRDIAEQARLGGKRVDQRAERGRNVDSAIVRGRPGGRAAMGRGRFGQRDNHSAQPRLRCEVFLHAVICRHGSGAKRRPGGERHLDGGEGRRHENRHGRPECYPRTAHREPHQPREDSARSLVPRSAFPLVLWPACRLWLT
jgi:hypothetical protein